ncbi:MAG: hypothetical protein RLZZ303_3057 [Candidatus Hydrogenedentota bacterium]
MIPYWVALLAYIPASAMMMMGRNNALCFSLAYLIGLLFLPSGIEIEIPGVPDLSKENVPAIGILIGTILFHPRVFSRFQLTPLDLLFPLGMMVAFISAYINGFGMRFGISQGVDVVLSFFLPLMLARIHLCTPASLKTFLITLVLLSVVYAPLALWEFRMSPQIHTTVYGYFQHVFQQHQRGSFWRPIVFFYHALSLARFFAVAAFLALFPLRKDLARLLGPVGNYVFIAPLGGLLLSQSISPMMLFGLITALYFAIQRIYLASFVLPVIAFVWLGLNYANVEVIGVNRFATISSERADSFQYRLDAISEYKSVVLNRFWFGHGGYDHGRIEGRATDSQMLVRMLSNGILGTIAYFGWWIGGMWAAAWAAGKTRGSPFGKAAAGIAAHASVALTFVVVDAGVDHFLLFPLAAAYAIATGMRYAPVSLERRTMPVRARPRRMAEAAD